MGRRGGGCLCVSYVLASAGFPSFTLSGLRVCKSLAPSYTPSEHLIGIGVIGVSRSHSDPSNERLQLTRLLARPSDPPLTPAQAKSRISAQIPLSQKLSYATQVLDNSGTQSDLNAQVDRLVKRWKAQQGGSSGWWWRLCWLVPPVGLAAGAICLLQGWWRSGRTSRRRGRGEVDQRVPGESIEMSDRGGRGDGRRRNTGSSVGSD